MKINTKQTSKKVLKISLLAVAVLAIAVVGYRYYNRPVQTWTAEVFEGRNPDKLETKNRGVQYWTGSNEGDGFYITDVSISAGEQKVYCVNGGVATDKATFVLGSSSFTVDNGFFTRCAAQTVNDKHQLSFGVTDGGVQVYRIDRKR